MSIGIEKTDRVVLQLLRQHGRLTVQGLGNALGVTATAIRQRLERLVAGGYIERQEESRAGRGRPSFAYSLTSEGERALGHNMAELAKALWAEVQSIEDPTLRENLLTRVSLRLAEMYKPDQNRVAAVTQPVTERIENVARVLRRNHLVASVESAERGQLPVLKISGCPYPELSQLGHEICEVEAKMLSEMAGVPVQLTRCRCDSADGACTFVLGNAETQPLAQQQPA